MAIVPPLNYIPVVELEADWGGGERDTVGLVAGPPPLLVFLVRIVFNVLAKVSKTCQVRAVI